MSYRLLGPGLACGLRYFFRAPGALMAVAYQNLVIEPD